MIKKADILERVASLVGKQLTNETLHEALFCEEKDQKKLRRFHLGKQEYVQFKVRVDRNTSASYAIITVMGNPNAFRVDLNEKEGQWIVDSEPKINYTYL